MKQTSTTQAIKQAFIAPINRKLYEPRAERKSDLDIVTLDDVYNVAALYAAYLTDEIHHYSEPLETVLTAQLIIRKDNAERFCNTYGYDWDHILDESLPKVDIPF